MDIGEVFPKLEPIDYEEGEEEPENQLEDGDIKVVFSRKQIDEMCQYGMAISRDLKTKVIKHGGGYKCNVKNCDYKNRRLEAFRNHLSIHRPGNPYKCPDPNCLYVGPVLSLLKIHMNVHNSTRDFKCPKCPAKVFKTKESLNGHRYGHVKVKCPKCSKMFPKNCLSVHLQRHAKLRKQYTCQHCQQQFISQVGWRHHVNRHLGIHKPKPYSCYFCYYRAETPTALVDHISAHTLERPWPCPVCKLWVKTKSSLTGHLKTHDKVRDAFNCPKCPQVFKWKTDLQSHVRFVHEKDKEALFRCPFQDCCYTTVRTRDFKKHQLVTHLKKFSHKCPHCPKGFGESFGLKLHLLQAHTDPKRRPFKCKVQGCASTFASNQLLRYHMVVHKKEREFRCHQCGKEYKRDSTLKTHQRRNHNSGDIKLKYYCYFCPKSFVTISARLKHTRDHTREIPYQCNRCGLRLKSGEMLTYHLRKIHSYPKPLDKPKASDPRFDCEVCGKSYSTKSSLTQHRKIVHEKTAKLHICEYGECGYQTPHKKAFENHVKRVHLDELYECKKCDATFKKPSNLSKHVKKEH